MTYTAETIVNIKRAGNLANYIDMERKTIAAFDGAEIKYDEQGKDSVSLAHLYGRLDIDMETASPVAIASVSYGDWVGRWSLASFNGDQARALAYARGALKNRLQADAKDIVAKAKARLASLEAAI